MTTTQRSVPAHARDLSALRLAPSLRPLSDEELAPLAAAARRFVLPPGVWTLDEALAREAVFVVARGEVRLHRPSKGSTGLTVWDRAAGDGFEFLSFDADSAPRTQAEVLVDGTVVYALPRECVRRAITFHPAAADATIQALRDLLAETLDRLDDLGCRTVRARVARCLARLARRRDACSVTVTREELAGLAQASPSEVSRVLPGLRGERLIDYKDYSHLIHLRKAQRLAHLE